MASILSKILRMGEGRVLKQLTAITKQVNALEETVSGLTDAELREETDQFKERLAAGETLDELLPEAFAVVREAAQRTLGQRHFDVQIMGGAALHMGNIAEMRTGEGKTLVATLPAYLNALTGDGVHVVTVNDYLARYQSELMGRVFRFLGLSTGVVLAGQRPDERREQYAADITYGTNNEFGFDYLRDNMVHSLEQRVQRGHYFAIIDEVDSVLIDEARTPLIISGPVGTDTNLAYGRYNSSVADLVRRQGRIVGEMIADAERLIEAGDELAAGEKLLLARRGMPKNKRLQKMFADDPSLQKLVQKVENNFMREKRLHEVEEHLLFAMDEKGHNVHLTDQGLDVLAPDDHAAFIVPDLSESIGVIEEDPDASIDEKRERREALEREYAEKSEKIHIIHQLLKAYALFNRDEQYVVQDGQILIVDEFTGRMMAGRRWSDGLHQAVEAKEGVTVKGETQTLATVTIQNYFRMYDKIAGMTGTAETEENEFHQIYTLDVMVVPTNRPIVREDRHDLVYKTKREKYNAIIEEIERLNLMQLPVLVGTVSVDVSETLSRMLKRRGIPHEVLNAKYHGREAQIVANAGQPGAVTIATNMAGRGTDIKLGPGVKEARTIGWLKEHGVDLAKLGPRDPAAAIDLAAQSDDFVVEVGGLHIIGSERHESRRIDRQLRGRAGRQGDPGASEFFLSLEDDLMRLFGGVDRIAGVMDRMGAEDGEVITHPLITRSIGSAQKRVEMQNFEARKRLLDYDDVMNQQREVIYDLRTFALEGGDDLRGEAWDMVEKTISRLIDEQAPEGTHPEEWQLAELRRRLLLDFFLTADQLPEEDDQGSTFGSRDDLEEYLVGLAREKFNAQLQQFGQHTESLLRYIVLSTIDERWKDHLYDLDHLKASIGFRGWGQKDPLIEYKRESYDMFVDLMTDLQSSIARLVFRARIEVQPPPPPQPLQTILRGPGAPGMGAGPAAPPMIDRPAAEEVPSGPGLGVNPGAAVTPRPAPRPAEMITNRGADARPQPVAVAEEVGRNDPCPCGSGKKYKKCHGR